MAGKTEGQNKMITLPTTSFQRNDWRYKSHLQNEFLLLPAHVNDLTVIDTPFPHGINCKFRTETQSDDVDIHHISPTSHSRL